MENKISITNHHELDVFNNNDTTSGYYSDKEKIISDLKELVEDQLKDSNIEINPMGSYKGEGDGYCMFSLKFYDRDNETFIYTYTGAVS